MSLATEITRIAGIKDNLIAAIEAKSVTVPADVTLDELPPLIDSLHVDDGSYRDVIERDAVTPILPEFPAGSILKAYAFRDCSSLTLTSLPSGITSIGSLAFYNCSSLTTLTFQGTPTSISANSFQNCTNLTIINVPWSSGAVANAPWGATNATINYNYAP